MLLEFHTQEQTMYVSKLLLFISNIYDKRISLWEKDVYLSTVYVYQL